LVETTLEIEGECEEPSTGLLKGFGMFQTIKKTENREEQGQ